MMGPRNRTLRAGLAFLAAFAIVAVSWAAFVLLVVEPGNAEEGRTLVPAGSFDDRPFPVVTFLGRIRFAFVVESGPRVDILLLTDADFDRYVQGMSLPADSSSLAYWDVTEVTGFAIPPEGGYHAVVDNTDYGVAQPRDGDVMLHLWLSWPGEDSIDPRLLLGSLVGGELALFILGTILAARGYRSCTSCPSPRSG